MPRLLISGPPSCGKSRLGRLLAAHFRVPHISSGELIRSLAAKGDPLAIRIRDMVADGSLAPSPYISQLVAARLGRDDCARGFILDGYPRKAQEALFLCYSAPLAPVDGAFVMEVPTDELVARARRRALLAAANGEEVRADDAPETFPRRITVYQAEIPEVHAVLTAHGIPLLPIANTKDDPDLLLRSALALLPEEPSPTHTAADARDLRDLAEVSLQDCRRAFAMLEDPVLGPRCNGDVLVALYTVMANGLAVMVHGDRDAWNFRHGLDQAARMRQRSPALAERFPAPREPTTPDVLPSPGFGR